MRFFVLTICLFAISLHAQLSGEMRMECAGPAALSVEDQLQELASHINLQDTGEAECRFSYMESLSRSKNVRALPLIARYLNVENPNLMKAATPESKVFRPVPFGGRYPAVVYITEFGNAAIPVLIQTISSEREFSLMAKNAVRALMIVEARNPPAGVQVLARAAKSGDVPHSTVLLQAADFATTTWECHSLVVECHDALTGQGVQVLAAPKQQ